MYGEGGSLSPWKFGHPLSRIQGCFIFTQISAYQPLFYYCYYYGCTIIFSIFLYLLWCVIIVYYIFGQVIFLIVRQTSALSLLIIMVNKYWQIIFEHYEIVITSYSRSYKLQLTHRLEIYRAFACVLQSEWGNSWSVLSNCTKRRYDGYRLTDIIILL